MFPAVIEGYYRPNTVEEALQLLKTQGDNTHFIAGGQSIMQAIKSRFLSPTNLIDLQSVSELAGISQQGGTTRIGAMTRYCDLAKTTALKPAHMAIQDAATHVGDRQVRNRGTIGGSLNWNYIASCIPPSCIGVGASVELQNVDGKSRTLAAEDFLGSPLDTMREEDEIMVAVVLEDAANTGSAYQKWGLVTDSLPVVNVCCSVTLDAAGVCTSARLVLGALPSGPVRIAAAENALIGASVDDAAAVANALTTAAQEADFDDEATADTEYKKVLLGKIGGQVITTAFERAKGAT